MNTEQKSSYKKILSERAEYTGLVFSEKTLETKLAEGVTYYKMKYLNQKGENVDVFAVVVEGGSKAKFRVWAGDLASVDDGKEAMTLKTVGEQARDLAEISGDRVVAAVNAGYFYIDTNKYPCSMRIIGGDVKCPPKDDYIWPDDWIGSTFDGRLVRGDKASYYSDWEGKGQLEYAVGVGKCMLVDRKVDFSKGVEELDPQTSIGITADGGFVLLCADGRPWMREGVSAGASSVDMFGVMLDMDAFYPDIEFVNVFTLDGGGSTEMVIENENDLITVNDPSDGVSRKVGDIIAVVVPNI